MPATSQELERWISENPDKIPLDESGRLIPLYKDESPVSNRTRGGRTD